MLLKMIKKALLMSAFFIACNPALALCPSPVSARPASVSYVFDGDTVALKDGRRVRLIGVNTPEKGRKGSADQPFAEHARRRLQQLTAQGVLLQYDRDRKDRYGRTLAYLYQPDGRSISEILIGEGLGFMVAVPPNLQLVDCLARAERQARSANHGIWATSLARPVAAKAIRQGGYQRVSGRISALKKGRKGWWMVLDDQLLIRMKADLVMSLSDKWREALVVGRPVVVSGWIVDRNQKKSSISDREKRWLLSLRHSSQFDLQP